jgi:16S rRNA A1518/A1519 N6-dimethyltransferase RsmA/KsgA/DIM1 with predicted DNA glycosylase/AP lyase activity
VGLVALGEEWTESEEWKRTLVEDVMMRLVPASGTVVEIGPGAGRWSVFLASHCARLIAGGWRERTTSLCRSRLPNTCRPVALSALSAR